MQTSSISVLSLAILFVLIVIVYLWAVMRLTAEKVFTGSGAPISMAKMVLSSIQITSQILFGVLAIVVITILIIEDKIRSDAGLPVISGIVGYILGKSFKDVYDSSPKNTRRRPRNQENAN
ncbi:MAG: hypothetical protein ACHQF4_09550 [Sphingobacteriales bacterium]